MLTEITQDPVLLDNYLTEKDIYVTLISTALGVPYESCTKEAHTRKMEEWEKAGKPGNPPTNYRSQGKLLQLALSYGLGVDALSEKLNMPRSEAEELMNDFKRNLGSVFAFEKKLKEHVRKTGYLKTLYGTKRRFPDYALPEIQIKTKDGMPLTKPVADAVVNSLNGVWRFTERRAIIANLENIHNIKIIDNFEKRRADETKILNSLIQGTGAYMIKRALVLVEENKRMKEMGADVVLCIHDEIVIEVNREHAEEAKVLLEDLMKQAGHEVVKSIPIVAEGEITERWEIED